MDRHRFLKELEKEIGMHRADGRSSHFIACQVSGLIERTIRERVGTVGFEQIFPPQEETDA